jgi:hypothetical protein
MSRAQILAFRESTTSRPCLVRDGGLDMLANQETSASSANWTHPEIGRPLCDRDSEEVSLRDLRERADRARAEFYVESRNHRTLVPQTRALIREAREISATLKLDRMRNGILVVEIKRNFALGDEIYEAALGSHPRNANTHGTSVQ